MGVPSGDGRNGGARMIVLNPSDPKLSTERVSRAAVSLRPPTRDASSIEGAEWRRDRARRRGIAYTRGQALAIAESNRKQLFPGGVFGAHRIPPSMRVRYHPSAVELGELDAFPVALVAPLVGKLFGGQRTPEQRTASLTKIISSPLITRLRAKAGLPSLTRDQAASEARRVVYGPDVYSAMPTIALPPPAQPTAPPLSAPSVSPAFYNLPSEFPASSPSAPSSAAPAASGVPPWLVPVAIGGVLLFFASGRH